MLLTLCNKWFAVDATAEKMKIGFKIFERSDSLSLLFRMNKSCIQKLPGWTRDLTFDHRDQKLDVPVNGETNSFQLLSNLDRSCGGKIPTAF